MLASIRSNLLEHGSLSLVVHIRPNAPTTQCKDVLLNDVLKIDVAAPPVHGKANAELIRFLAEEFAVSKNNIVIVSGHTAKRKVIRVCR